MLLAISKEKLLDIGKEVWLILANASVFALFLIHFHVVENIIDFIDESENIQKAKELLNLLEEQEEAKIYIEGLETENGDPIV